MQVKPLTHEIEVFVEVPVYPSEAPDKVRLAVEKLLPEIRVEPLRSEPTRLEGRSNDGKCLSRIYSQLRSRATLGVARRLLSEHATETSTWIFFNKQAAFMGTAAICEEEGESPLGPIRVTVSIKNIRDFIDWLAPMV